MVIPSREGATFGGARLRAALFVVLCWLAAPVAANSVQVTPIIQALPHGRTVAVYTVSNTQRRPLTVQIEAHRWDQQQSKRVLSDAEHLLVVPPLFTLAQGQKQLVRVAYRGPTSDDELAYRVRFQEVPERHDRGGVGVRTAVTMDLPLFFLADEPRAESRWRVRRDDGKNWLSVTNTGNRYLRLSDLAAAATADAGPVNIGKRVEYILAGKTRKWPLPELLDGEITVYYREEGRKVSRSVLLE